MPMGKQNILWLMILLAMAVALLLTWLQPTPLPHHRNEDAFDAVQQTYRTILRKHYRALDAQELRQAAVEGMAGELDPFSRYYPPQEARRLNRCVMGVTQGLGLRLRGADRSGALILGTLPGSPAHKTGLQPDDRILMINDQSVVGMDRDAIDELLAGPIGESVTLTIQSPTSDPPVRDVSLQRAEFPTDPVAGLCRTPESDWLWTIPATAGRVEKATPQRTGTGYIRIREFTPETHAALEQAIRAWRQTCSAKPAAKPATTPAGTQPVVAAHAGLILDLRGNPGGLLPAGVATADLFLAEGSIITVVERSAEPKHYVAHDDSAYHDLPLVVLIDEESASAAELVAAALAGNARAVLLGRRTRGKGCVQSMIELPENLGLLNLTTAEFYLHADQPIQRRSDGSNWGVEPHMRVDLPDALRETLTVLRAEADVVALARPQPNDQPPRCEIIARKLLQTDPQLRAAAELLAQPAAFQAQLQAVRLQVRRETMLREQRQRQETSDDPTQESPTRQ